MPNVNNSVQVPTPVNYPTPSYVFNSARTGLFSECSNPNDLIYMMTNDADDLMAWIPKVGKNTWNENVLHLSYAVPKNYTGSKSYIDFNRDKSSVDACEYSPTSLELSTCEYQLPMYRFTFSNKNDPFKLGSLGGIDYCNKDPRMALRGEYAGLRFDNDFAWVLSGLAYAMQSHMSNVLLFGSGTYADVGHGEYDGLLEILTSGYVASKKVGSGECKGQNPIIYNAASKTDAADLLLALYDIVFEIYNRHRSAGYTPQYGDIALVIHSGMWAYLAEYGATLSYLNRTMSNSAAVINYGDEAWVRRYQEMTSGGMFGTGDFMMPGFRIPIITNDLLAAQTTQIIGGVEKDVIKGTILVLSRTFRNTNVLEHHYINWNEVPVPSYIDYNVMMDGQWLQSYSTANTCWHVNIEGAFRLVSRAQRLQARINQATVVIRDAVRFSSGNWMSKDFFAYEGAAAHVGVSHLNPNIP